MDQQLYKNKDIKKHTSYKEVNSGSVAKFNF